MGDVDGRCETMISAKMPYYKGLKNLVGFCWILVWRTISPPYIEIPYKTSIYEGRENEFLDQLSGLVLER